MDIFAPGSHNNNCFTIQNISPEPKTIRVFQYPINWGGVRDLLKIPGVAEDDIRASLLKGELRHKILSGEITVLCSDIDLLQFNVPQYNFLVTAGITNGLKVSSGQLSVIEQQDIQLVGAVDGINTIFTIPSGIWIQSAPYKIVVYKNGVKQVLNDDFTILESNGLGTGYNTVIFAIPPENSIPPSDIITADYYISNI